MYYISSCDLVLQGYDHTHLVSAKNHKLLCNQTLVLLAPNTIEYTLQNNLILMYVYKSSMLKKKYKNRQQMSRHVTLWYNHIGLQGDILHYIRS